jgi:hypothetical protein
LVPILLLTGEIFFFLSSLPPVSLPFQQVHPDNNVVGNRTKLPADTPPFSMVTACIVLLYISYSIPVVCLLIKGRDNITHGPFWMGSLGLFSNCVLLLWTAFSIIMYSFPPVKPVHAGSKFSSPSSFSNGNPLPPETNLILSYPIKNRHELRLRRLRRCLWLQHHLLVRAR